MRFSQSKSVGLPRPKRTEGRLRHPVYLILAWRV